jgi:hypothetical protein
MNLETLKPETLSHLPDRYAKSRGDARLVYRSICLTLSDRQHEAGWDLFGTVEWDLLLRMAEPTVEGVGPLLFWKLRAAGWPPAVPRSVMKSLERSYYHTLAHNLLQFRELGEISTAFSRAGIPLVILKGAALSAGLYEDAGLRPMGDLDVLVPHDRLSEAAGIAHALGFDTGMTDRAPWMSRILDHHVHLRKLYDRNDIALEIHYTLVGTPAYRFGAPVDWFWTQIEPIDLSGQVKGRVGPVSGLNPTAQLLFLAAHAFLQHGGGVARLLWLYDMDKLVRIQGSRIDYDLLFAQAGVYRWTPAVAEARAAIRSIFDTPVPEPEPGYPGGRGDRGIEELVSLKNRGPRTRTELARHGLKSVKPIARLLLFLAMVFPHPDYIKSIYRPGPGWRWLLCYPRRWLDLIRDALGSARLKS